MNRGALVALLLLIGIGLGLAIAAIAPLSQSTRQTQTIEWLAEPKPIANFSLATPTGVFNNDALNGRWTIVVFGFLNCPDLCPTSLAALAKLIGRLHQNAPELQAHMAYRFVSADPDRDSVAEVDAYARQFAPQIQGATGVHKQIEQLADSLGIAYKVTPNGGLTGDSYQVAHSITFSIVDPSGVFRGRFRPGFNVEHFVASFAARATYRSRSLHPTAAR